MCVGHDDIVDISTTVDLYHLVSCLPPPVLNPATRVGDNVDASKIYLFKHLYYTKEYKQANNIKTSLHIIFITKQSLFNSNKYFKDFTVYVSPETPHPATAQSSSTRNLIPHPGLLVRDHVHVNFFLFFCSFVLTDF